MKITEYREKWAKYDPIAWSKCNICHQKYPNDEIVQHICDAAQVWGGPRATEHTKNASYRGGRAAN